MTAISGSSRARGGATALALAASALLAGCGDRPGNEDAGPAPAAGRYAVVEDSSSVHVLVERDGRPLVVSFPGASGTLAFREGVRHLVQGTGTVTVDLSRAVMDDSLQTRAVVDDLLRARSGGSRRSAELNVRSLFGKGFTTGLAPGAVTPLSARAQLIVGGMALSRQFEGEIARTPGGYRITTALPVLMGLGELGLADDVPRWLEATGGGGVGEWIAVTVDLRLVRRGPA